MKIIFCLALLCCLAACNGMTNDQIIAETKKCEAAGLTASAYGSLRGGVSAVVCYPKQKGE